MQGHHDARARHGGGTQTRRLAFVLVAVALVGVAAVLLRPAPAVVEPAMPRSGSHATAIPAFRATADRQPSRPVAETGRGTHFDALRHVTQWYDKWGADLERVRARVRSFCLAKAKCYSEEVELELAYLRIRATRPRVVYEISPYYGYSSLWLLSAVKDNGEGRVISFDVVDYSVENIPDDLKPLHTFVHGDARELHTQQPLADYLFLDSMHSKEFGEFFTSDLFARHAGRHVYVSLHDVYNPKMWSGLAGPGRDKDVFPEWMPTEEGLWVLTWLAFHNEHCHVWTPAPSCPHTGSFYADVLEARARVVTSPSVYARDSTSTNTDGPNPTIFFELNCEQAL